MDIEYLKLSKVTFTNIGCFHTCINTRSHPELIWNIIQTSCLCERKCLNQLSATLNELYTASSLVQILCNVRLSQCVIEGVGVLMTLMTDSWFAETDLLVLVCSFCPGYTCDLLGMNVYNIQMPLFLKDTLMNNSK